MLVDIFGKKVIDFCLSEVDILTITKNIKCSFLKEISTIEGIV
jgi:hypothetical protein